ncbi:N,N-dimethylformamidase beta subunit family domain-containing protein [Streptomyces sp. NPDC089799]|uniref:N,N-dimethylformamidase beta subunit family domain-containing protein n=1 Tax=Streptomyces sp. NPDC089799 TaxID=3155066 RepID=UPI0034440F8C
MVDGTAPGGPEEPRRPVRRGPARRRVLGLAAATFASSRPWAGTAAAGPAGPARPRPQGGAPSPAYGLDVRAENSLPGAPDWRIRHAGPVGAVEGFTDRVSVRSGEVFGLHVSTTSASYTVSAYRMGWYGGARARLVWRSAALPGERQPAAVRDPVTRMVHAPWRRSAAVDTRGWPEGCYLLRLDTTDGRAQRYVPVTVRGPAGSADPAASTASTASTGAAGAAGAAGAPVAAADAAHPGLAGRVVVVNAVATWQAYNRWGGADMYQGATGKKDSRSLAVAFDRPYANRLGAGQFLFFELPLIALAERLGLPLAYATGVDVAREPELLRGAAAVVSPGHDEYWTPEQRRHVTLARDTGTNLAVFGANCCYRRVRYEPSALGADRVVVCWKDDYAADPGYRRGLPPTTDFRRQPAPDPESSLLGVIYEGYPVDAPYVVSHAGHWLLAGTGVRAGDAFPHLVGVEYDRVDTGYPTPRPVEILAHSPVVCKGRASYADTAYVSLPGGAGVFATGTMRWVEALDASGPPGGKGNHGLGGDAGRFTRVVTENVLKAFARGPAGRARPALDNVLAHYGEAAPAPAARSGV